MEFTDVLARRRMVRRFDPGPLDPALVHALVRRGLRGPSAGNSAGIDLLVLADAADRGTFWAAASDRDPAAPPDAWRAGVGAAPVLVLVLADPDAYRARYARPDKAGRPAPADFWDVDAGMAAMILLLGAVDAGLGALFFGVPPTRHDAVHAAFDIPAGRRIVGVVALGRPAPEAASAGGSRAARPRPDRERLHVGRFGAPGP